MCRSYGVSLGHGARADALFELTDAVLCADGPVTSLVDLTLVAEHRRADRWTWLVIAAHTQLRLARPLTQDLRRPWEKPAPPGRLTPARVRRGFGTSAHEPPCRPTRPNPPDPAPDAHPAPRTAGQPSTTTSESHQTRQPYHRRATARRLKIKLRPRHANLAVTACPWP